MNASLPTRWLTDPTMADLTACEFATHARALMFGIEHETDGLISTKSLRLLVPHDCVIDQVLAGLIENAIWTRTSTGFQIVDWSETQTTKAAMERTRKQGRERQREFQARRKEGSGAESEPADGVTNALLTRTPQIRQDQASTDKIKPERENEKREVPKSADLADAYQSADRKFGL